VGGGHNGLVCANYLAKENMNVLVLERRYKVGGAAVSEEIFPGYTFSRASYLLSLLRGSIIEEIFPPNWREEMPIYARDMYSFTPMLNGEYMRLYFDKDKTYKEISKFSKKDAVNYPKYQ